MVTQNMLRTHSANRSFQKNKNSNLWLHSILSNALNRSKTEIAPYVRTYIWVAIQYKYHAESSWIEKIQKQLKIEEQRKITKQYRFVLTII